MRCPPARGAIGCFRAPRRCRRSYRRALVSLSDGGKDAAENREFDIAAAEFVGGGFFLPEGKQSAVWLDADTLLVARDWGPGTMTRSGYPFVLKRLGRSMPLDGAVEIFRGSPEDVSIGASVLRDPDGTVRGILINRQVSFFDSEWHLLGAAGPIRLQLPARVELPRLCCRADDLLARTGMGREGYSGRSAGLARPRRVPRGAAERGARSSSWRRARAKRSRMSRRRASRLLVTLYRNVRGGAVAYRFEGGRWIGETLPLPEHASVHLVSAERPRRPRLSRRRRLSDAEHAVSGRPCGGNGRSRSSRCRRVSMPRTLSSSSSRRRRRTALRCPISSSAPRRCRSTARRRHCFTAMAGFRCR